MQHWKGLSNFCLPKSLAKLFIIWTVRSTIYQHHSTIFWFFFLFNNLRPIQTCLKCKLILCFSLGSLFFLFCSFCSFSVEISKMCYFYNITAIVNCPASATLKKFANLGRSSHWWLYALPVFSSLRNCQNCGISCHFLERHVDGCLKKS